MTSIWKWIGAIAVVVALGQGGRVASAKVVEYVGEDPVPQPVAVEANGSGWETPSSAELRAAFPLVAGSDDVRVSALDHPALTMRTLRFRATLEDGSVVWQEYANSADGTADGNIVNTAELLLETVEEEHPHLSRIVKEIVDVLGRIGI